VRGPRLHGEERPEGGHAGAEAAEDGGVRPAEVRRLDQAEDDPSEREHDQRRPGRVDRRAAAPSGALRHPRIEDRDHRRRERNVDVEDGPPARVLRQPPAQHRPRRHHQGRKGRPRADGPPLPFRGDGGADQGEAVRHEHCRAQPLQAARRDELPDRGGEPAPRGREREEGDPRGEDAPPAEAVAERSPRKEERRQEEGVHLDHPLRAGDVRPEVGLKHRKRHVHRRPVDERQARPENARGDHPGLRAPRAGVRQRRRSDQRLVARRPHRQGHAPPPGSPSLVRSGPVLAAPPPAGVRVPS